MAGHTHIQTPRRCAAFPASLWDAIQSQDAARFQIQVLKMDDPHRKLILWKTAAVRHFPYLHKRNPLTSVEELLAQTMHATLICWRKILILKQHSYSFCCNVTLAFALDLVYNFWFCFSFVESVSTKRVFPIPGLIHRNAVHCHSIPYRLNSNPISPLTNFLSKRVLQNFIFAKNNTHITHNTNAFCLDTDYA